MGFTLQSFTPFRRFEVGFPSPFRSCTFLKNSSSLSSVLQRLTLIKRAAPLTAIRRISSDRDLLLSWVFGLFRLSLETAQKKVISPFFFPFHTSNPRTLRFLEFASHRVFSTASHGVSPYGRQPAQLFLSTSSTISSSDHPPRIIFSSRKPNTLSGIRFFLFAANALLPNGRW